MQTPPRLDLGTPPQPQQMPPHFPPPPYREEPAPAAEKSRGGIARILPTVVTLGAFAGLAVLAWFAYQEGQAPVSDSDIPVIKADEEPFKRVPENPGGEEIPHTDKEVYNSFTSDKPDVDGKKAEVVPDAERPMDRAFLKQFAGTGEDETGDQVKQESVPFGEAKKETKGMLEPKPLPLAKIHEALPNPNTGGVEVMKKIAEETVPAEKPEPTKTEEVKSVPAAKAIAKAPAKKPVVAKKEVAKPKTETKTKPAAKAKPKAAVASGIRVQLGAFRSDAEATREWKKIQGKHKSELSKLHMMVQKVEIPDKGTMYRLQAGPVSSKDAAHSLCKKLVAAGQGCFVAK